MARFMVCEAKDPKRAAGKWCSHEGVHSRCRVLLNRSVKIQSTGAPVINTARALKRYLEDYCSVRFNSPGILLTGQRQKQFC